MCVCVCNTFSVKPSKIVGKNTAVRDAWSNAQSFSNDYIPTGTKLYPKQLPYQPISPTHWSAVCPNENKRTQHKKAETYQLTSPYEPQTTIFMHLEVVIIAIRVPLHHYKHHYCTHNKHCQAGHTHTHTHPHTHTHTHLPWWPTSNQPILAQMVQMGELAPRHLDELWFYLQFWGKGGL